MFGKSKLIEEIEELKRENGRLLQENNRLRSKLLQYEPLPRKEADTVESDYDEIKAKIMAGKKYQEFEHDIDNRKDNILSVSIYIGGIGLSVLYSSASVNEIARWWKLRNVNIRSMEWDDLLHFSHLSNSQLKQNYSVSVHEKVYFGRSTGERMWTKSEAKVIEKLIFEKFDNFSGFHNYTYEDYGVYHSENEYIPNIPNISAALTEPY